MAAEVSAELGLINDEDVLRKMWQQTEDFGKKKEIRARMYKLREQRLKEFYTTDVASDIALTGRKHTATHHVDSIADQGFMSMKTKEIRDSESPTRDIHKRQAQNNYWNTVHESYSTADDGGRLVDTYEKSMSGKGVSPDGRTYSQSTANQKHQHSSNFEETENSTKIEDQQSRSSQAVVDAHTKTDDGDVYTKASKQEEQKKSSSYTTSKTGNTTYHSSSKQESSSSSSYTKQSTSSSTSNTYQILPSGERVLVSSTTVSNPRAITDETNFNSDNHNVSKYQDTTDFISSSRRDNQSSSTISSDVKKNENISNRYSENTQFISNETADVISKVNQEKNSAETYISESSDRNVSDRRQTTQNSRTIKTENENSNVVDQKIMSELHKLDSYLSTQNATGASTPVSPNSVTGDAANWTVVSSSDGEFVYKSDKEKGPGDKPVIIKHPTSLELPKEATEGQYVTTYQQSYQPKKISVEHSPTHDAFARSLRTSPPPSSTRSSSKGSLDRSSPDRKFQKGGSPTRRSPEKERRVSVAGSYTIEKPKDVKRKVSEATYDTHKETNVKAKRKFSTTQAKTISKVRSSTPGTSPSTSPTRMNRDRSSSPSDSESDSSQLTYNKNTSTIKRASTRKSSKDQSSPERSPTRKVQSPTKSITHGRSTPESRPRPSSPTKATPSEHSSSRKSPSPTKAKPSSTSPDRAPVRSPSPTKTTGILRKDSKSDSASTILIKSEIASKDVTKSDETQEIETDTLKKKTDTDSQVSEFISKIRQEEEMQKEATKSSQTKLNDTVDDSIENKNTNKMTYHSSDEITITKTSNAVEDEAVTEITTDKINLNTEDQESMNKKLISKEPCVSREDELLSQGVINNEESKTQTSEFIQIEKTGTSSPTIQPSFRDKSPEYSSEGSVTKEIKAARGIGKKNASTPDSSPERSAFKPIREFRTEPEIKDKISVKVQPSKYPAGAPSPVSPKPTDKKTPSEKDQTTKPQSCESSPTKSTSPSRSASPMKQMKNKSPVRESKSSSVSPYSSPDRSPTKKIKPADSQKPSTQTPSQVKDTDKTKSVNQRTNRRSSIPRAENVTSVTRKVSEKKIEPSSNKKPTARVPSFEKRVPLQKTQNVRSDSQSSITRRTVTTRSDSQSSITKKTVTKTVRSSSARDMNTQKTLTKTPSTTKVKTTAIINLQRPSNKSLPVQNSRTNASNVVNVTVTTKRKVNETGPRRSQPIESKPQTPKQASSKVIKKEVVQKTVHKDAYDGSSDRSSSVSSPETVKPVDVTGTKKQSTVALSLICSSNVTSKHVKSNDFNKSEIDVEDLEDELPPAEFLVDDYEDDEDKPVEQVKSSVKTAPKTQPKPGTINRAPSKASPAKPSTTNVQNRSTLNKRVSNESITKTQSNKNVTAKTIVVKKDTSKQDLTVKSKANVTLNNRNSVATKVTPTSKSTPTIRPAVPPKKKLVQEEPETSSSEDEETNITENVSIITEDQQHYIDELEEIRQKEEQEYAAKLMATTNQEDSLLSVIVQHPKSSRESSPGHPAHSPFCAVSDDGGAHPRYADLISEPEDVEVFDKTKPFESSSKRYEQVTNLDEESETEDLNVSVADRVSKFLATSQAVSSPKETPEKPTESPKTERKEVLKAKHMFETIAKNQTAPPAPNNKPVDILSRPSVFEGRQGVTTPKDKFDTFPKTKVINSSENLNKTASTNDLLVENNQTHVDVEIEENTSQQFIKNESKNVLKEIQIENIDSNTKSNKVLTEQKQETTTRDQRRKSQSPEKETQPRKDSIKDTPKKQAPGKKYPGTENKETKTLNVGNRESKISSKKDFFERKANAEKNTTLTKERPLRKEPPTPAKPKKPSDSQAKSSDFIQNERKTSPSPRASPERKPATKRAESPDVKKAQTKTVRENSVTEITRKQSTERRTEIDRKSTASPTKDRRESPRASPDKQVPSNKAKSPERSPKKESPREKSPEKVTTTSRPSSPTKKAQSPERAAPTERKSSLKRSSPERKVSIETSSTRRQSQERTVIVEGETVELNKAGRFGVTLKRTPSTTSAAAPRRLSTPGGEEIEDIFQLELLEQMLEKAVGYETRRRIRSQIRIVKKMIEDGEIQVTTTTTTTRKTTRATKSPVKEVESKPQSKPVTDSYKKPETKKPVEQTPATPVQRPASPTKHKVEVSSLKSTFEQKGVEIKRAPSPSKLQDQHTVKKTTRIETSTNVRSLPREKEPCPITSSYGVGPTDDEGRPLFGLKALRRSNTAKTLTDEPASQAEPKPEEPVQKGGSEPVDAVFDARGRPLFGLRALQVSSLDTAEMPEASSVQIRGLVEKHEQNARTSHKESKTTVITSKSVVSSDGSVSVNREVIKGELSSRNGEEPTGKIVHSKYSYQTPDDSSNKSQGISSTVTTTKTIGGGRRSSGPKITEIEDSSDERRSSITSSRRYSGAKVTEVEEEECERLSPDESDSNLVSSVIKKFSGSKTSTVDNDKSWQKSSSSKFVTKSNSTVTESKSKSYTPTSQQKVSDDESADDKKKPLIRGDSIRALQHKFQQATVSSSLKQHSTTTESKQRPNRTSVTTRRNSKTDSSVEENNFQTASKTVTSSSSSTSTRVATEKSSFLDNTTRVTGVQDILQRMRNADLVVESGDTDEDTEARALLNKFLGASVILQGMEQGMKAASAAKTNGHASSPPTSAALVSRVEKQRIASSNTNQLSEEELENIWDEKQLRNLLEACSDYEGRRRIRARLRAVMAEQKVCADVVAVAASGATGNSMLSQGELPVSMLRPQSSQSSGVDDSGTESGEDLRLLSPEVLAEVQGALGKLETALPSLDPGRREALLQLVSRLQTCLQIPKPATPPNPPPRRFSDRRLARRSRHTVGVSREELADARRWLQENQTAPDTVLRQNSATHLPLETNEPSLVTKVFRPVKFNPIIRSTSEETYFDQPNLEEYPIIEQQFNPILYKAEVQYMSQTQPLLASVSYVLDKNTERLMGDASGSSILEYDPSSVLFTPEQSVQIAVHKAAINKQISKEEKRRDDSDDEEFSSTEDDHQPNSVVSSAQRLLLMATDANRKVSPNLNRFHTKTNKKMKMKRANTIDIPKPQNFYDVDGSSCDEFDRNSVDDGNLSDNNKLYRNNHSNNSNRKLPFTLEPKTANDFKFLAFLQQTSERENKAASYNPCARGGAQWSNRFSNIKTAFEPGARRQSNPNVPSVSKSMWHNLEQQQKQPTESDKRHARTPQPIQKKLPWTSGNTSNQNENVVIGSITVAKKTPGPINQFSHAPKSAFKPPEKKIIPPVQPYNPPSASGTVKLLASQKFSGQNPSPKPILKQYPPQDKILNSFKPKTSNKDLFQKQPEFKNQQDSRGFVPYTKLPHEVSQLPKVTQPIEKIDNTAPIKPYYIQPQKTENNRVSKVVKSLESEKVNEVIPTIAPHKPSQSHHAFKHQLVKVPSCDESFNYSAPMNSNAYERLTPEVSSINNRPLMEERMNNYRSNYEDNDSCPQTHFIPASPIQNPSNLYIPNSLPDTGYSSSSLKSNSSFEYSPSSPNRTPNINNCFPHNFSPQRSAHLESRTSSIENELNIASNSDVISPLPISTPSQYYIGQVQNNLLRIPSNLPTGRSSKTSSIDDDESASASPSFWANEEVSKIINPIDQFESQTAVTRVMGQPHQAVTVTNKMRHRHESAARKIESHILSAGNPNPSSPSFPNVLQKSESWHQMVKEKMAQAKQAPPLPKIPKAKSSHALAFPKQFETAQPKELLQTKQSTVEQYLKKSKSNAGINKLKERRSATTTATKVETSIRLDEDLRNVDEAFESLFNETSKRKTHK